MRRIIAATDFSERAQTAQTKAIAIAKQLNAHLTLLHAINQSFFGRIFAGDTRQLAIDSTKAKLRAVLDENAVSGGVCVEMGEASEVIITAANELHADLLIFGDHGEFDLLDFFLGATARRTVEHSLLPLLVIKSERQEKYKRILLSTDFSHHSKEALNCALELFPDAHFVLFNAYLAPNNVYANLYGVASHDISTMFETLRAEASEKLSEFAAEFDIPAERLTLSLRACATPSDGILEMIKSENADLLVMGTKGMGSFMPMMVGSVTDSLLRRSPIDMLILKR